MSGTPEAEIAPNALKTNELSEILLYIFKDLPTFVKWAPVAFAYRPFSRILVLVSKTHDDRGRSWVKEDWSVSLYGESAEDFLKANTAVPFTVRMSPISGNNQYSDSPMFPLLAPAPRSSSAHPSVAVYLGKPYQC